MAFLQSYCHHLNNARNFMYRTPISAASILSFDVDLWTNQKRYAARKGKRIAATREKQKLARLRREEMKIAPPKVWKPQHLTVDKSLKGITKKFSDANRKNLSEIVDNVYILEHYKEKKYSFLESIGMIRETHQPEIYDEPNALVEAKIELDLRTKKKTKFVGNFNSVVSYPNLFPYGIKRKVLAVCKTDEDQELARNAGAELAGCGDIIRMIKVGDITLDNFDELVCHGDMLIELNSIRGSIGQYFPTKQRGNVGFDMNRLVKYFINGIEFKLNKDDNEPDYGYVQVPFGRLNQSNEELQENLETLLKMVDNNKPEQAPGDFITRVLLFSDPAPEKFAIAFWNHIDDYDEPEENPEAEPVKQPKEKKANKN